MSFQERHHFVWVPHRFWTHRAWTYPKHLLGSNLLNLLLLSIMGQPVDNQVTTCTIRDRVTILIAGGQALGLRSVERAAVGPAVRPPFSLGDAGGWPSHHAMHWVTVG